MKAHCDDQLFNQLTGGKSMFNKIVSKVRKAKSSNCIIYERSKVIILQYSLLLNLVCFHL